MHICCRTISRPQNDKYELCWKLTLTTEPPGRLSWIPTIRIMLLSWPLLTTAGAASWDRLSSFLSHRLNTATILLCFGPMLQLKYKYLIEAVQCTWYPILYTLCIYNDKYHTYYTSNMKYQITCTYCCVTVAVTAAIPLCCWTMSEPSPVTMYCTPCLSCNITIVISVNTVIHIFLIIMLRNNPNLYHNWPLGHLASLVPKTNGALCDQYDAIYQEVILTTCSIPSTGPPDTTAPISPLGSITWGKGIKVRHH